jgi:23S rRNA (uracil1939-C5)-methyltransferase
MKDRLHCRHFGSCGGCDILSTPYDDQLRLKRDRVVDCLRGLVALAPVGPCLDVRHPARRGAPPAAFRQKVHFVFMEADGRLHLAHYSAGGRDRVSIAECPAHAEEGNRLAWALREALEQAGLRAHPHGPLRDLLVRTFRAGPPSIVTLVVTDDAGPRLRRAVGRFLDEAGRRVSMFVSVNAADTPLVLGGRTRHIAGPRRGRERVAGIEYLLSASSFFQTNVDGADALVDWIMERLEGARPSRPSPRSAPWRIVDLYAGVGLFALPLAQAGHRVVAVEENPDAVVDGLATLRRNGIPASRCRFVRSPVRRIETWASAARGPVDLVILDPPREGIGAELLARVLARVAPRFVAYVSCEPASLARDLAGVVAAVADDVVPDRARAVGPDSHSYRVELVQPIDMFPHTRHVETLVWMARSNPSGVS